MASMKTAISLPEALFKQAEQWARKMKISRSRLFVLALEDFLRRQENKDLLEQINRAYEDEPDDDEKAHSEAMRRHHRRMVEGKW